MGVNRVFHALVTLPTILRLRGTMPNDQMKMARSGFCGEILARNPQSPSSPDRQDLYSRSVFSS